MVTFVGWDFYGGSELQQALIKANIEYRMALDIGNYGLETPYLVVDGVPLDHKRALIWIKEHSNNG